MTVKKAVRSLAQFASEESVKRGPQCFVCNLEPKLRNEIELGRKNDPVHNTYAVIANWLRTEHGLKDAVTHRVGHHLKNHVAA